MRTGFGTAIIEFTGNIVSMFYTIDILGLKYESFMSIIPSAAFSTLGFVYRERLARVAKSARLGRDKGLRCVSM